MDISSSTYECQYVNEGSSWSSLNKIHHFGYFVLILAKDMIMEFIQSKASMNISSSTYECQYVTVDNAWITLNKTKHLR
jgi:hypothetical protein